MSTKEMNNVKDIKKADSKKTVCVDGQDLNKVLADVKLEELMGTGNPMLTVSREVEIDMNYDWISELSTCLIDAAYAKDNKTDKLKPELLESYLRWVFLNRLNYIKNGRNAVHPRDVKYPVVIYDALARLAIYEGTSQDGGHLIPTIKDSKFKPSDEELFTSLDKRESDKLEEKDEVAGSGLSLEDWIVNGRVQDFPRRLEIVRLMEQAGIQLATGLPMEKRSNDRTMYEMQVEISDAITTAGAVPSIAQVFSRCFYAFEAVTELVGPQKVELLLYKTIKAELYNICDRYVKQMRS